MELPWSNNHNYQVISDPENEDNMAEAISDKSRNWNIFIKITLYIGICCLVGFGIISNMNLTVQTNETFDENFQSDSHCVTKRMIMSSKNDGYFNEKYIKLTSTSSEVHNNHSYPDPQNDFISKITANSHTRYQQILGFGGAFTEASAINFYKLAENLRNEVITSYFHINQSNYNMGRLSINSNDFSLGSYSFDEFVNDYKLEHFDANVTHDEAYIVPFIKNALIYNKNMKLIASPWSPPGWMKRNSNSSDIVYQNGLHDNISYSMLGSDSPSCLRDNPVVKRAWATYISQFISAYRSKGINIWAVTPQNEPEFAAPWEACVYNASYEKSFIQEYLGPILSARANDAFMEHGSGSEAGRIKIFAYDHNKEHLLNWTNIMFNVDDVGDIADTSNYIDGMAFHWYTGAPDATVRMLDGTFGYDSVNGAYYTMKSYYNKQNERNNRFDHRPLFLLSTEGCSCAGVRLNDWLRGERLGHDILYDLANYAEGYIMWNLLLDEEGGPNHLGNVCDSPIVLQPVNPTERPTSGNINATIEYGIHYQPIYYFMKHFSHFINFNATRIESNSQGNYNYQQMDPRMHVGIEIGLFACEHSVRQLWVLNENSQVEMKFPSLVDPTTLDTDTREPTNGDVACEYDGEYVNTQCDKQRLCLVKGGPLRSNIQLGDCESTQHDGLLFKLVRVEEGSNWMLMQALSSSQCLTVIVDKQQQGYLMELLPCSSANRQQLFQWNNDTGEIIQRIDAFTAAGNVRRDMCLTAGWPFFNAIAFSQMNATTNIKETVVVLTNEGDMDLNVSFEDTSAGTYKFEIDSRSIATLVM